MDEDELFGVFKHSASSSGAEALGTKHRRFDSDSESDDDGAALPRSVTTMAEAAAALKTSSEAPAKKIKVDLSLSGPVDAMKLLENNSNVSGRGISLKSISATEAEALNSAASATPSDAPATESTEEGDKKAVTILHVASRDECRHEIAYPDDWVEPAEKPVPPAQPAKTYPFTLDAFQREAVRAIEHNESVLVSAHTSAGKTAVAEYAIALCLREKQRVIYTSPIKALSNQKYREFFEEFQDVGLMTGDVTISPNASILVMTTEILRSMLYRGSEILREVAWVVFDEIHYMRDKERGVVWEESIILLPDKVRFVFLSATIPNAKEFADWVANIHHQPCHVVYTDYRPTPLQHYMFPSGGDGLYLIVDDKGRFREDNFQKSLEILSAGEEAAEGSASGGGGGGGGGKFGGKRRQGGNKGPSDVHKIIKMIMERQFEPVIVFSFSKRECETLALQVSKIDFNSEAEKELVDQVFKNAIDSLSEDDQKLPQVQQILPLLRRGIGIHHSGLLPILKEVIELLFQEQLLKVLFSTETFSMGLNMPARTVVFTNLRKFDGKEFRWLTSGEYIQMSGRAGRRGLDDRGIVIMMVEEKMDPSVAKQMFAGKADPLNSSFHLNYNMLLNLLRVEEVDPEYLMQRSFFQFQNDRVRPLIEARLTACEKQRDEIVIPDEDTVTEYFLLRREIERLRGEMLRLINQPAHIVPFLQPGRVVRVKDTVQDWGFGVVVSFQKKTPIGSAKSGHGNSANADAAAASSDAFLAGESPTSFYIVDVLIQAEVDVNKNPRPSKTSEHIVVPFRLYQLSELSSLRLFLPKDLRPRDSRASVGLALGEVRRRFPTQVPLLDPIEDMKITDAEFKKMVRQVESCEDRLFKNALHKRLQARATAKSEEKTSTATTKRDSRTLTTVVTRQPVVAASAAAKGSAENPDADKPAAEPVDEDPDQKALVLFTQKQNLEQEAQRLRRVLKSSYSVVLRDTLRHMKRVLRRLGAVDATNVIQLKGRVGCEINTADELLLTELLFNGCFNDISSEQVVALLSCFVCQEKGEEKPLKEELAQPLRILQETARKIATVSQESKIQIDVDEYVQTFRPLFMEIAFAWCQGKKFVEICKLTDTFEGTIIRAFRRLEELLRQLVVASKVIGDQTLELKFERSIELIKRDIVFAASLYL